MNDTIVAISTALGIGAISIIRVSGEESIKVVNKLFKGKNLERVESHTINYGYIVDKSNNIIDEVLVTIMKSPKTFTREDIVEINCHGGISTTNKVLELIIMEGVRLAEPGEFTKRAFLNGRIDLIEADGIMNLISSKTEKNRELAINQLSGRVSSMISGLREDLVSIISNIEVNIDYPEYEDIEVLTTDKILPRLIRFKENLKKIIKESHNGRLINEGIKVGIIGKPNVGKSSLLNALLEEEKAIVTEVAGTTRDIVEGTITVNGILLNIIDTAGIRETKNIVEKLGVEKSLKVINDADLIILMLNNNEKLTNEDKKILNLIKTKKHIVVINKIDLEDKVNYFDKDIVRISLKDNTNLEELKGKINDIFNLEQIETKDLTYLSNARSIALLNSALEKIEESIIAINNNEFIDIVELGIKESWSLLGEIIGETYNDELIDNLFSKFCLGK